MTRQERTFDSDSYSAVTVKASGDPRLSSLYDAHCPARDALGLVGEKWAVLVVLLLADQPFHFGQLRRALDGVSQKMLTQTLRNLERNGLVQRRVFPTRPPSVEYSLTTLGIGLAEPLLRLGEWVERHTDDVIAARERFDSQRAAEEPSGVVALESV
jgi:DNA-binding HxlR family transcriptional regulator